MSPEVWQKVSGALDQLSELTGPARIEFLEKLRADDPFVCKEVESLSAQATVSVQLESPPTELLAQLQPTAALNPPPELPKQLGGYRIVSILGAGGMGVVYEAEDPTLERRVALKVIKREVAVLPDARARFLREARAAAALQHDHVLPIYHVGEEAGVVFLVMPLLHGETLEDRLRNQPDMPLPQILRIGRQIAEGLAAAHARGLIHRDIKPANLWLEAGKDRVKIMDFGLARAAGADGNLTQTGMIFGTPAYMAPEQGRGEEVDGRADLFSLGCVLYRLCTGTVPFQKKDALSMLVAAASEPVVPPSQRNRAIPQAVSDLILRLLAKSAADRPQSAQEVVGCLETLERSAASLAAESARAESKASQPSRSRWARVKLWAIAVVPVILAACGIWYLTHRNVAPAVITNSIGMKLTLIPAGDFMMGSPDGEAGSVSGEHPQHRVQISRPFYLGTYTVTRGQFAQFVAATNYQTDAEKDGKGGNGYTGDAKDPIVQKPEFTWRNTGFAQTDEYPVVNVSWNDAVAFCKWLGDQEGANYRLPTEAEWEYACRAGTATRYFFGDNPQDLALYANTADITAKQKLPSFHPTLDAADGFVFTAPVGSFRPNPLGLYDMLGNVWQYCSDWYASDYYGYGRPADPPGPAVGSERVIRGGSWVNSPARCRCAGRGTPGLAPHDCTIGFRVVRGLGPPASGSRPVTPPTPGENVAKPPATATTPGDASTKQPTITNSIGMQLTLIPAGDFIMGSPTSEKFARLNEHPPHHVMITKSFYMGTYSVTRGQFSRFVAATGYKTDAETDGKGGDGLDKQSGQFVEQKPEFSWQNAGYPQTDEHPVVNVSWNDAVAFCKWLSEQEGKTYRLPTEAEWEYACRAGTSTAYFFGNDPEAIVKYANVADAAFKQRFRSWGTVEASDGYVFTAPVGSFRPNSFGLYDMLGNVWQWCSDSYAAGYYKTSPPADPQGPAADASSARVQRGGGFANMTDKCRCACRAAVDRMRGGAGNGFRVVCGIKQPTITNSLGMQFTLIPAGEFMMGSPDNEPGAKAEEHPQHTVRVTKPFYIGTYSVTRGQFAKFVAATNYKTDAETDGKGGRGYTGDAENSREQKPEFNWRNPGFPQTDEHPVVNVSWNDAVAFCKWLGAQEGKTYRLPTEAEWEYACRAGTTTAYYFGDNPDDLASYGNLADAAFKKQFPDHSFQMSQTSDGYVFTAPVGSFRPNRWGLFDMAGNVWQWCSDWYGQDYYKDSPMADPPGPAAGISSVRRGGGFDNPPACGRCSYRSSTPRTGRLDTIGFRVVREPDPSATGGQPKTDQGAGLPEQKEHGISGERAIAPRVAETGKLIFKDDFDTDAPQPIFVSNLLNFENVNGVGQLSTPTKDVLGVFYVQNLVKNFVAECDFEIVGDQPEKACGFYFRGQPKGVVPLSTYLVLVHPRERKVTLACFQSPTYTLWNEYTCDDRIAFGQTNRLRLEALGAEFRIFINGVFACRMEDSKIAAEGTIGLGTFSAVKGDYTVKFKNLRVYQLDAPYTEPEVKPRNDAPRPAPLGDLAFKDDFDTAVPLATSTFPANVLSFANQGGKGHYTTKMAGVAGASYPNHALKDFIAEVEIESQPGAAMIGYGLLFRGHWGVGEGRPSYRVLQLYPKEQKVWLGWMQETSWNYWIDHPCPPKLIFIDRPNVVRLEAKDDRFRVFINGSFVWQLIDARSKEAGLIGLSANAAPGTEVRFSKLRVFHFVKEGKSD